MTARRPVAIFLILAALAMPAAAAPTSEPGDGPDGDRFAADMRAAGEMIRQGLEKMLGTIDGALRTLPRYELPTIDENGDIVIRRKRPDAPDVHCDALRADDRERGGRLAAPGDIEYALTYANI